MFGRKKVDNPKKSRRSSGGLAQFGLIDIPDFDNFDKVNDVGDDDDEDDDDLEAELLALTAGAPVPRKQKKVPAAIPAAHLDKMVAESLKDIPSDESVSGDDDDPALLEELTGLISDEEPDESGGHTEAPQKQESPVKQPSPSGGISSLLNERLAMYQQAEANAKAAGESARARRFSRGIKTLTDLIKQAKTGKPIDENEIPPPVAVQIKKPTTIEQPESESQPPSSPPPPPPVPARTVPPPIPQRTAPSPPSPGLTSYSGIPLVEPDANSQSEAISPEQQDVTPQSPTVPPSVQSSTAEVDDSEKEKMLNILIMRRDQYKLAAVKAKRNGDVETALRFVKVSKQFDTVINAVNEGKPVDLSAMPPPPPSVDTVVPNNISDSSVPTLPVIDRKEEQEKQRSSEPSVPSEALPEEGATSPEEEVYQITASSVGEALEQRLKVYQMQEQSAREAGNASKARRMGRIVKQYQDAIKLHKAGKPIPVDELPTPPGYAPIPVEGTELATGGGCSAATSSKPATPAVSPLPSPVATKPITPAISPSVPSPSTTKSTDTVSNKNVPEAVTDKATQKINARRGAVGRQMSFLVSRQKEFKLAALEAKKKGEINQAKEYLRLAKGFEPLLDAASSGLPIDMDSVPVPPSAKLVLESDFDVISSSDCVPNSDSDIYEKLESDLTAQLKINNDISKFQKAQKYFLVTLKRP
ncbi:lethal (2) giant discs 1 [Lycorma delicatula]|uniref:lethal (2) giant discs 1 n=1 Tax=Lycorma delicatula TaxID=130591 RepID=UPI003F51A233